MFPKPVIYTLRLALRPFKAADAQALHKIYQSEGVLRYFPNPTPPSLDKVERFIAAQQLHWEQHQYGNWGILQADETRLIGWAGLQFLPETNETEVGYLLDRPFWGKGYATEAARASLQFAFENCGLCEITALVHPGNTASLKVAAKCGMSAVENKTYWGLEMVRHTTDKASFQESCRGISPIIRISSGDSQE